MIKQYKLRTPEGDACDILTGNPDHIEMLDALINGLEPDDNEFYTVDALPCCNAEEVQE